MSNDFEFSTRTKGIAASHTFNVHSCFFPEDRNISTPGRRSQACFDAADISIAIKTKHLSDTKMHNGEWSCVGMNFRPAACIAAKSRSYLRSDNRISEHVHDVLLEDPYIDVTDIEVNVDTFHPGRWKRGLDSGIMCKKKASC